MRLHSTKEKLSVFVKQTGGRMKRFTRPLFDGTNKGVYGMTLLAAFLLGALSLTDIGIPGWIAFFLFGALATAAAALTVWIGKWILKACLYRGEKNLIVLVIIFGGIYYFCMWARMDIVSGIHACITAGICVAVFALFPRSLYAFVWKKRRSRFVMAVCLCSGLMFAAVVFLTVSPGFSDSYVGEYVKLGLTDVPRSRPEENCSEGSRTSGSRPPAGLSERELRNGEAQVGVIEYGAEQKRVKPPMEGVEADLESTSVDLSPYVDGYRGLDAKYRELCLGYGIKNVPLAGRIWYPKQEEDCPVVFLIHGNHNFTAQSYLGYAYLGEYLASHGYVAVSVDENFCNADLFGDLKEENDARAVLLLENIGKVFSYNKTEGNPLYGKIDETRIAVTGHSRGGEAAVAAAYFNQLACYPENGTIRFDYGYAIRSVIAIAPSVNQYLPLDRSMQLSDINYLLLQGANDQDVSVFLGMAQYSHVTFTGDGDYFKSYLYIAGANHGQFNTEWGRYDMPFPLSVCLNVKNLMPQEQQQVILKVFAKKFLDVTLLGQEEGKSLFYDVQSYREFLPQTVYVQGYADSACEVVCNFEEDLDLTTGTMDGSVVSTGHAAEWTEKLSRFSSGDYCFGMEDNALSLKWKNTKEAYVRVQLLPFDAAEKSLCFDILDMDNTKVRKGNYRALDATIVLTDQSGRRAQTSLGAHCIVYPPLPVRLSKLQYLFGENDYKHQFQTVRIPVDAFEAQEGFDASCITEIRFCFDHDASGSIRLDDVGFMTAIQR